MDLDFLAKIIINGPGLVRAERRLGLHSSAHTCPNWYKHLCVHERVKGLIDHPHACRPGWTRSC
jgi:hypothetical protein